MGKPANNKKEKVEYPLYEMEEKGKLILPPEILSQITFLHSHVGRTEWSGMLLYDVINGNPSKPETFELEVKHIFLMDIGSAAYTEYEADGDIVDIYDNIPEAMEWKTGHVHSHHDMTTYFSTTDMGELHDNVDKHNYYLSLIVAFNGSYTAKVAFLSDMETTSKMTFKDDSGNIKSFKQKKMERHMVVINMRILFAELGGFFSARLTELVAKEEAAKEAAEKAAEKERTKAGYKYGGYGGQHNSHFHNQNMDELPRHSIGSKIIPDKMTSWEIENLTKSILMLEAHPAGNVYSILHQVAREDQNMDLYPDYLMCNAEAIIDEYFDDPLADDEYAIVIKECIMCIKKYEGVVALAPITTVICESLAVIAQGYEEGGVREVDQEDEGSIAAQLEKAEKELKL
jgi:hypothetical protein